MDRLQQRKFSLDTRRKIHSEGGEMLEQGLREAVVPLFLEVSNAQQEKS